MNIFESHDNSAKSLSKTSIKKGITFIALLISVGVSAQESSSQNLGQLIPLAIENNLGLKAGRLKVDESKSLINSAFNFNILCISNSLEKNRK